MERLAGTCEIHRDGVFVQRSRCWFEWKHNVFVVEVRECKDLKGRDAFDRANLDFRNAEFLSSTGLLQAELVPVSFRTSDPFISGLNGADSTLAQTIGCVEATTKWPFVCNETIILRSAIKANETIFSRKTKPIPHWFELFDGSEVHLAEYGLTVRGPKILGEKNEFALGLALGCPLTVFVRQMDHEITLNLNEVPEAVRERPLFDRTKGNGFLDIERYAEGFVEVYRAAMVYQDQEADGGAQLRFATDAFLKARVSDAGYIAQMLTAFQLLEWLNHDNKIKSAGHLEELLGIEQPIAQALSNLRNAYMHNQKRDGRTRAHTDLLTETDKACDALVEVGFLQNDAPQSTRTVNLYNYILSLMQMHLLERIGANVEPCPFIPGHGVFDPKRPQIV